MLSDVVLQLYSLTISLYLYSPALFYLFLLLVFCVSLYLLVYDK